MGDLVSSILLLQSLIFLYLIFSSEPKRGRTSIVDNQDFPELTGI